MSDDDNGNVFQFGSVQGGKGTPEKESESGIPVNDYVVVDVDDESWYATGFLIFTPHHLAIMFDSGNGAGAIPVLVLPINRVKAAELYEDDTAEDEELPF